MGSKGKYKGKCVDPLGTSTHIYSLPRTYNTYKNYTKKIAREKARNTKVFVLVQGFRNKKRRWDGGGSKKKEKIPRVPFLTRGTGFIPSIQCNHPQHHQPHHPHHHIHPNHHRHQHHQHHHSARREESSGGIPCCLAGTKCPASS